MLFQNIIASTPIEQLPKLYKHRLGLKTGAARLINPIGNSKFVEFTNNNTTKTKITIRNRITYNTYK